MTLNTKAGIFQQIQIGSILLPLLLCLFFCKSYSQFRISENAKITVINGAIVSIQDSSAISISYFERDSIFKGYQIVSKISNQKDTKKSDRKVKGKRFEEKTKKTVQKETSKKELEESKKSKIYLVPNSPKSNMVFLNLVLGRVGLDIQPTSKSSPNFIVNELRKNSFGYMEKTNYSENNKISFLKKDHILGIRPPPLWINSSRIIKNEFSIIQTLNQFKLKL